MLYRLAADSLVLFHLCCTSSYYSAGCCALSGGRFIWLHLPAAAWGVAVVRSSHLPCPLTRWEKAAFAISPVKTATAGGFIEHYISSALIYPAGLTPQIQLALGDIGV